MASEDEAKHLQTEALRAPEFMSGMQTIVETTDEWKNSLTISSSCHFFLFDKKYRQLGYSSNDYVNLGYEGTYWDKIDDSTEQVSYELQEEDCTIENGELTITNFENIGYIDRDCVVKVKQESGSSLFKLGINDNKIG